MNLRDAVMPDSPYKGLMPYAEEDAAFFFGREPEREIITANLLASRLTLLYGASGVGKSSVLRAGVAHHLRQLAQQNRVKHGTPEFIVVVFSSWRDEPTLGLAARIQDSVAEALNGQTIEVAAGPSLAPTLQAWSERTNSDLLVILDQFEEYFLYHPSQDGEGTFTYEFARAVNRPDLRASFLISIREDALAKLDRFKGRIPNLFDNYLRVEHLSRETARMAIENPIEQFNRLTTATQRVGIEPALVEAVLEQVKTGQVVLGDAGRGIFKVNANETHIETPFLQLVMTRLWDEEMRAGSRLLQLATLNRLGGAERIVKTHLDETVGGLTPAEQDTAARVFRYLVTPTGAKIAHTVADLADYAGMPLTKVEPVLEKLSYGKVRILRPVSPPHSLAGAHRYEIFHDVLASAILDWRARYMQFQDRSLSRGWIKSFVFTLILFGFPIGALIIVPTLRRMRPPLPWKQVAVVSIGWITAWLIAFAAAALIYGATEIAYNSRFSEKTFNDTQASNILTFGLLYGAGIGGCVGGRLVFRQLTRPR